MSYFSYFPLTTYTNNSTEIIVTDILRRAKFISEYKPYTDLYFSYTIMDGDTPQSLALKYYGSVNYYWVILLFNEIHNPEFDWPMEQSKLERYCSEKYGEDVMNMVRHYERKGIVVGEVKEFSLGTKWVPPQNLYPTDLNVYPVTFIEYEERLSDDKRSITILRPELLSDFVSQFEQSINYD